MTRKKMNIFLSKHQTDEEILDIGAGGSSFDKYFPNRITLDIDEKRNPDIVADAHSLPFEDGKFNTILCTEVLEHLEDPKKAINEMSRVLKPGGKLILTTRFIFPLHDTPYDFFRFTKYGLKKLFGDWKIIELEEEAKTMETIGILLQRIAFQTNLRGGKFSKFIFLLLAKLVSKMDFFIKEEFGKRREGEILKEDTVMASGYYLVCKKK